MGIIGTILIGLVVGGLARFLMPGRDPMGCLATVVLGVLGALVGAYLGRFLGLYNEGEPAGFVMSLVGALILLFIYHKLVGRKGTPPAA